jgi:2-phospho-L-lactate guanylyltransferase
MTPQDFVALVPVKPTDAGKSRLTGLADGDRAALARAFALDTVAACLASPRIVAAVVVTDDVAVSGVWVSVDSAG